MMEWYSTLEENEIMTFASSCIELAILVPGAVSPAQDDKSAFSYLWKFLKVKTNVFQKMVSAFEREREG